MLSGSSFHILLPLLILTDQPFSILIWAHSSCWNKISRALGMLRHTKQYLPLSILQIMYRSLVEPYSRFCCPVWGVFGTTALAKLHKLQNRAAKIVTNGLFRISAQPIISRLGWKAVNDLIEMETMKMVFRSSNHEAPEYLTGLFHRWSETSTRQLRYTNTNLHVPFLKTACGQKYLSYRGAKLWNNLNRESKMAKAFTNFKSSLKLIELEHSFYFSSRIYD